MTAELPKKNSINKIQLFTLCALLVSCFSLGLAISAIRNSNVALLANAKGTRKLPDLPQTNLIDLNEGEALQVTCQGKNLLISRKGRDQLSAWCVGLPKNNTNQPDDEENGDNNTGNNNGNKPNKPIKPTKPVGEQGCTTEAKICPDGSSVGRTLPDCEFAPCPNENEEPPNTPVEESPTPTPIPL